MQKLIALTDNFHVTKTINIQYDRDRTNVLVSHTHKNIFVPRI